MKDLVKPVMPVMPIMPNSRDYPRNIPIILHNPFAIDYAKYQKKLIKYNADLEIYEQTKLIKFIKNADTKLILKKYKIIKK